MTNPPRSCKRMKVAGSAATSQASLHRQQKRRQQLDEQIDSLQDHVYAEGSMGTQLRHTLQCQHSLQQHCVRDDQIAELKGTIESMSRTYLDTYIAKEIAESTQRQLEGDLEKHRVQTAGLSAALKEMDDIVSAERQQRVRETSQMGHKIIALEDHLQKEIEALAERNEHSVTQERSLVQLRELNANALAQILQQSRLIGERDAQTAQLNVVIAEKEVDLKQKEGEIEEQARQIKTLEDDVKRSGAKEAQSSEVIRGLNAAIIDVEAQVKMRDNTIRDLKGNMEGRDHTILMLEREVGGQAKVVEELREQLNGHDSTKEDLKQQVKGKDSKIEALEQAVMERDATIRVEQAKNKDDLICCLRGQLAAQGQTMEELMRRQGDMILDLERIVKDRDNTIAVKDCLLSERDAQIEGHRTKVAILSQEKRSVEEDRDSKSAEADRLQQSLQRYKEEGDKREALEARIENLTAEIIRQADDICHFKWQLEGSHEAEERAAANLKECQLWKSETTKRLEIEIKRLKGANLEGQVAKLESDVAAWETRAAEYESWIDHQEEEIATLKESIRHLTESNEQGKLLVKKLRAKIEDEKKRQILPLLEWGHTLPEIHKKAYRAQRRRIIQKEDEEYNFVAHIVEAVRTKRDRDPDLDLLLDSWLNTCK